MRSHTHFRPGAMLRGPALLVLIVSMLVLPPGQPPTLSAAPANADRRDATAAGLAAVAARAAPPGAVAGPASEPVCDPATPLPGKWARLLGDDEIMVGFRYESSPRYLRNLVLNDVSGSLVKVSEKAYADSSTLPELQEDHWVMVAAADLDGDRKAELVSGYKDNDGAIGSIADGFSASAADNAWRHTGDREQGDPKYIDVAAGNLDRSADGTDEVALFFRDDKDDYHVKVLDGDDRSANTGIIGNADNSQSSNLFLDSSGRGNILYAAVAAGDLNGDGYDDEIVTAFKDSDSDLQVIVLRHQNGSASLKSIYTYDGAAQFGDLPTGGEDFAQRPIAVTAADVDGDMQDEIVVAFPNIVQVSYGQQNAVRLVVFDLAAEDAATQTLTMTNDVTLAVPLVETGGENVNDISMDAADLDGDGADEIALGYDIIRHKSDCDTCYTRYWQQTLLTFDFLRAGSLEWRGSSCDTPANKSCLAQRPGIWNSGLTSIDDSLLSDDHDNGPEAQVSVKAGDLDQDGLDEIAMLRLNKSNGDAEVRSFDAAPSGGLTQAGFYSIDLGSARIWEFALDVGDQNGDSIWGEYNGRCYTGRDAVVQAVVHAPPFWPTGYGKDGYDNDYRTAADFAASYTKGEGTGSTIETIVGGEVKVTAGAEKKHIEFAASYSHEWEKSAAASTERSTESEYASGVETLPWLNVDEEQGEVASYEAMTMLEVGNFCYEYDTADWGVVPVCVPQPSITYQMNKSVEAWYAEGPEQYPDSWTPLGMNLAQGRAAAESSTYANETPHGDAWRAVDGSTDGDYYAGSVSHTNRDPYAWLEVDLGGLQWIDAIRVWNRTDCSQCVDRLKNFYVFVTDQEQFSSTNPNDLLDDGIFYKKIAGPVEESEVVPVLAYGRRLRIQLDHQDYLHLAEVQVFGMPGTPDQWPEAAPAGDPGSGGSFTLQWRDGRTQVVAGQLYLQWPADKLRKVAPGSDDVDFSVGRSGDEQHVTETGTTDKNSLGMEVKFKGSGAEGSGSWGTTNKQSTAQTWGAGLEFHGVAQGFLSTHTPEEMTYTWAPYVWLQKVAPAGGGVQQFLVLDYWTPTAEAVAPSPAAEPAAGPRLPVDAGAVTPAAPLIDSPTHPDPDAWYTDNTATFTWAQPNDDPATVTDYSWLLDGSPDTTPRRFQLGATQAKTYAGLADGAWYLHVAAMSDGEQWSETTHRRVRVDAHPPAVTLALDPAWPTGSGGWYTTPVTIDAAASDGAGSGVVAIEVSTDGIHWGPYITGLTFTADTPGATLYARAWDAVGHVSDPVSTTFRIDRTAPDSRVKGGAGPGALVAKIVTDAAGNEELVLAGALADATSGPAGMDIGCDGQDWTGVSGMGEGQNVAGAPGIAANWVYTATHHIGAGYHIFQGRGLDAAGNLETPYEIGRVLWLPKASPELGGSSVSASQAVGRPGDALTFALVARNAGFQEAHVTVVDTLPEGLIPVAESLPPDVAYDATARTLTWPARLLWPGQWETLSFRATIAAGLAATRLENRASFHAFWPNTDLLPADQQQQFEDFEQTVVRSASIRVDPGLPADADVVAPWVSLSVAGKQVAPGPAVTLNITAGQGATRMYVREWTPDPTTGAWVVRQNSGWMAFSPTLTWELSAGQGVRFLGVWVADAAGNVSTLSEASLTFVNRLDGRQALEDGARVQYRGLLHGGEFINGTLATISGDPDAYIYRPRNAFWPDQQANAAVAVGEAETFSNRFPAEAGRFLLEVLAVGPSEYTLGLGKAGQAAAARAAAEKARPEHPLTVANPLSAGQVGPAVVSQSAIYLPAILR